MFHRYFQNFPLSDTSLLWNRMSAQSVSVLSCSFLFSPSLSWRHLIMMCATPHTSEHFICAVDCTSLLSWLFLPDPLTVRINHINRLTWGVGSVCVVESWEACGALSQAGAMNQGWDSAILCCNNRVYGVDVFICKLQEMLSNVLKSLAQFCDHPQVMLNFIFFHL